MHNAQRTMPVAFTVESFTVYRSPGQAGGLTPAA
jgi:hypothetical protein